MLKTRLTFKCLRPLLGGLMLAALTVFMVPPAPADVSQISYDQAADRLTVQAEEVSLKYLLARITLVSGVAFLIDPAVEQPVSISLVDRPLEKGLIKMVQTLDLSYAMVYQKKEGQAASAEPLLISMKIVPKDMANNPNPTLVSNLNMGGEAHMRTRYQRRTPGGEPSTRDYAEARWQARLKNLPEDQRKRLEEDVKRRQAREAAQREKRKARREKHQKKLKKEQATLEAINELLKADNPERSE